MANLRAKDMDAMFAVLVSRRGQGPLPNTDRRPSDWSFSLQTLWERYPGRNLGHPWYLSFAIVLQSGVFQLPCRLMTLQDPAMSAGGAHER